MKKIINKKTNKCKQIIVKGPKKQNWKEQRSPMFQASNIHYEMDGRYQGLAHCQTSNTLSGSRQLFCQVFLTWTSQNQKDFLILLPKQHEKSEGYPPKPGQSKYINVLLHLRSLGLV